MHPTAVASCLLLMLTVLTSVQSAEDHRFCFHTWISLNFKTANTNQLRTTNHPGQNGRTDVFVMEQGGIVSLSRARQDGTFSEASTQIIPGKEFCDGSGDQFEIADVNGDSQDDMVCLKNGDGSVHVRHWERRRYGVEMKIEGFTCDGVFRIGDFDGNGADDYLCTPAVATALAGATVYLNTACKREATNHDYPFHRPHHHPLICRPRQPVTLTIPDDPSDPNKPVCDLTTGSLVIGDVNGDGKDDIICNGASAVTGFPSQITEDTVSFGAPSSAPVCALIMTLVDVDGDGDDDVACTIPVGRTLLDYADSTGYTGALTTPDPLCPVPPTPSPITACEAGDFNGDGREDLLCRYDDGNASGVDITRIYYAEKTP